MTQEREEEQQCKTSHLLHCWAPITTRLLEGANSSSWYVLDNVMTEPVDFVSFLRRELERNRVLQKLCAAKTSGERQADDILSLLQQKGLVAVPESTSSTEAQPLRGDKSTFLGRDMRQQAEFSTRFPHLHSLIQKWEQTAQHHLGHWLEFDFTLTSVQVAEFPGDGVRGYPRHCDRNGNLCRSEKASSSRSSSSERLLTGVYYLTPDDWDQKLDGGCLRLFGENNGDNGSPDFTDVAPYRNRMIVFRSDGVEHEVRPSLRRSRLAVTIWLYGRAIKVAKEPALENQEVVTQIEGISGRDNVPGPPSLPIRLQPVNNQISRPTIFVSVAAYRDAETGPTLRHLAAMASYPERVFVGLMLQLDSAQDTAISMALPTNLPWYQSNVRCLQQEARHALGPCYARALCQSLFRGEDYFLQIDSHMRFRRNWDAYLIQELDLLAQQTSNDKIMLTAYPVGYELPNQVPSETRGTLLVPWKFDQNGVLRQRGRLFQSKTPTMPQPVRCYLFAAGFNFSRSQVIRDCPYDESLHHLFFGEELSMAVRLFTKGYDLYAPCESVCYHLWSREHRQTQSSDAKKRNENEEIKQRSMEVVRQQLMGTAQKGRHGLGSIRTPQQFAKKLGVNFGQGVIEGDTEASIDVEFVTDSTSVAPNSLEAKVWALEASTKNLIAAFLEQVSK